MRYSYWRMHRIAWLLLAVFCTALAQVQPVAWAKAQPKECSCCQVPGACGMPDCGPVPVPSTFATVMATSGVEVSSPKTQPDAPRAIRQAVRVHARHLEAVTASVVPPARRLAARARAVPLFKAHCRFLI